MVVNFYLSVQPFSPIFNCLDPDQDLYFGSGFTKLLNTAPIWIYFLLFKHQVWRKGNVITILCITSLSTPLSPPYLSLSLCLPFYPSNSTFPLSSLRESVSAHLPISSIVIQ